MLLNIHKTLNNIDTDYDEYIMKRRDVIYLSKKIIRDSIPKVKYQPKRYKPHNTTKIKKLKPKVYTDIKYIYESIDNG
jgi:hypothetical protein